jgi:hypothetical protein
MELQSGYYASDIKRQLVTLEHGVLRLFYTVSTQVLRCCICARPWIRGRLIFQKKNKTPFQCHAASPSKSTRGLLKPIPRYLPTPMSDSPRRWSSCLREAEDPTCPQHPRAVMPIRRHRHPSSSIAVPPFACPFTSPFCAGAPRVSL